MFFRLPSPTLRRTLFASGMFIMTAAAAAMLGSISLAVRQRDADERDSVAFMDEQRIADQIVAMTYEQQLDAYRFLQRPDTIYLRAFRARGDEAYGEMRGYLFHELSTDARLQVENIKEAHQQFEVAAERAFDLVQRGQSAAAMQRLAGMDRRAAALDVAVRQFLQARASQRDAFRLEHEQLAQQHLIVLIIAVSGIVLLVLVLTSVLRRRVIVPLDHLATAARQLGDGDTSARVPKQLFEEFDVVATGFNQMADRVQASHDDNVAQNQELRKTVDHLRTTQEELVQHEKLSAMGQMLAGLAHELNNPLAGVLGMAELLRDELTTSNDAGVRRLGTELALPLATEAKRARDLVRNLLSFARKPSEALEPVALSSAVGIAIGLRTAAYAQAGKAIETSVASSLYVRAETQKLQHVIVNLVNNALDAMTDHGTTLRISAFVDDADRVHLCFDDEGHGFTDAHAAFEPFYTTKPTERGTGLGLTLARKFVQEFGGSVIAENRAEGGARVAIVLHRVPAPAEDVRDTPMHALAPAAPATAISIDGPTPPPRRSGERRVRPRVLVVDDEPSLRELQRRFLHREGFDVLLACNGEEARQLLSVEDVDLVISDLRMPGKTDGRALIAWIEQHQPHLADHILVVTGDLMGLQSSTAREISADRVLSKPFTREEYLDRVRTALEYLSDQPTSAASSGSTG